MTIVDSSVWIDYFNGKITTATDKLDEILGVSEAGLIDLIYMEVLQGFRSQKDFLRAKELFSEIHIYPSLSSPFLLSTIDNYRKLRKKGITPRKSIDNIIATFCILKNFPLLHSDKDFRPYQKHLGLMVVQ